MHSLNTASEYFFEVESFDSGLDYFYPRSEEVNGTGGEVEINKRTPYRGEIHHLEDGQVIDLGGRQIEVLHTPGHTSGSVTFFDKERHYGFSGDAPAPCL